MEIILPGFPVPIHTTSFSHSPAYGKGHDRGLLNMEELLSYGNSMSCGFHSGPF